MFDYWKLFRMISPLNPIETPLNPIESLLNPIESLLTPIKMMVNSHFYQFFWWLQTAPVPSNALHQGLVGFQEVGVVTLGLEDAATTCLSETTDGTTGEFHFILDLYGFMSQLPSGSD